MKLNYELTDRQDEAWELLTDNTNRSLLYGGAKGCGKSFLFCLWVFYWVNHLIDFFDLKDTKNPMPLGFIGRKQSIDFHNTTLETWKKIIPSDLYTVKEQPHKEIIIRNLGKVLYGGLDKTETINKFNSAEYAFYAIDQAEETERKEVSVLEGALRLVHMGKKPPYKILYTANPAEGHIKEDYYRGKRKGSIYIPALYTDNPHLPKDYEERLDSAFSYDPDLLQAYKEGNWDILSSSKFVIDGNMIDNVKGLELSPDIPTRIISCDPSMGGDECVLYVIEDTRIIETKIGHWNDSRLIADEIDLLTYKYECNNIVVDYIGWGEGVVSRLREKNKNVIAFEGYRSSFQNRCGNLRAESYWLTRMLFMDRNIYYPNDEELQRQLCNVMFRHKLGNIFLEDKKDVKKRIGRSPDRADAYTMGIWGLQFMLPESNKEINDKFHRGLNPEKNRQSSYGW